MITKDAFVNIMNALRDYNDGLTALENSLNTIFEDNCFIVLLDNILGALSDELESNILDNSDDSYIYTFAFTCDWGRDDEAGHININGHACDFSTPENLYDFLRFYTRPISFNNTSR